MSLIWRERPDGCWHPVAIPSDAPLSCSELGKESIQLLRFGHGTERGVVLLARPGVWVRVNGQPVLGGVRVLEHQDEILLGSAQGRCFFSAEATPVVVPFRLDGNARPPSCPVCRGVIREGDLAVRCPGCSRWYHQLEAGEGQRAKHCWTYYPTCRFDGHPTSLDGTPVWRPELEETHD